MSSTDPTDTTSGARRLDRNDADPSTGSGVEDRVEDRVENHVDDRVDDQVEERVDDRVDERVDHGSNGAAHAGATSLSTTASSIGLDRESVVQREKERYGGVKVGSAFFGWLTATGTAVLLTALVGAAGTAVGVATGTDVGQAVDEATRNAGTVGIAGGIALLSILLLAYFCGGYVAGRMARFNGAKQGVAVWVWAVVIAVAVAILGAVAGSKYNVLGTLNAFPRIPVSEGSLTTGGIVALFAAALAALVGAVLGGLAGMRYHRKVDRAGLAH